MKIEVLVATMNQYDYSLIKKMNISTGAIIGNQCNKNIIESCDINGKTIKWLSFNERGVGLNRNNALMRSGADVCILADDDMFFVDDYEDIVRKNFEKYKNADVIIFNIHENPILRYVIKKSYRVNWYNFMRFGAARVAFKRKSIIRNNIYFNLLFGGGCKYSAGEDTIFLHDCLRAGLKVIAVPYYIATLKNDRESTWFKGYNEKYFFDKGALFGRIFGNFAWFWCFIMLLKNNKMYGKNIAFLKKYKYLLKGIKEYNEKS